MKVVLGAAALALLFSFSAVAQTAPVAASECPAIVPVPTLPDGASADRDGMEAGNVTYTAWAESHRQILMCRRAEAEALHARWQARVDEHNAGAALLNTSNTSWEAEVAEFNGRSNPRRSR